MGCMTLSLKGQTSIGRWKDPKSQRWWMTPRKQCLSESRPGARMNSQRLWHQALIQSKENPGMEKGAWTQNPTTRHEVICKWYLLGNGNPVSSVWGYWVYQPHPRPGPMPRSTWPSWNGLFFSVCLFWFILVILFLFRVCLFLFPFFVSFYFVRDKEHEVRG